MILATMVLVEQHEFHYASRAFSCADVFLHRVLVIQLRWKCSAGGGLLHRNRVGQSESVATEGKNRLTGIHTQTRGTGGRYTDHLMCQLIASDETLTRVLQEVYVLGKPWNEG